MEERYEIRGKIGQGGLGAVYRGYDTRMNREVAIKRISTTPGDPELQEESTRQLIKEAGALASLQHPHIVTVYDVGTDEDGPYVVMELISGKTLDELIEKAPLTWPDFRELALQTQEALIAAQELDLIHSDIKPSNLMLTWLPSGKFQVKIVDFGLATLTQSQSREEIETLEAVFGSIFFMAPEQFERVPLDARADIYSMGCVYYQALTGAYPFDGKTGNEVMQAHLNHTVTPIQELRSDIPMWACDWIMWQINRHPKDRPESARESLSVFLQNDKNPNPTMSLGQAQAAVKRPRLIIPGSEPAAAAPAWVEPVPVALTQHQDTASPAPPPTSSLAPAPAIPAAVPASLPPDPAEVPEPTKTKSAPQPLTPPEGSKPSVHTSSQALPEAPAPVPVAVTPLKVQPTVAGTLPAAPPAPPAKRKLSNAAKVMIAIVMALLVILLGWILIERSAKNARTRLYNEMIAAAAKGDAVDVPVNAVKLDILLESAANTGVVEHRQTIYKALALAKATDGTDVDARIAAFATGREMLPEVREILIRDVLRMRKNPAVVPTLMEYARRATTDSRSAVATLQAVRFMAGDEQFDQFLETLTTSPQPEVRKAAEDTLSEIIKRSKNRDALATKIAATYENTVEENNRLALLRLIGRSGGPKALDLVKKALDSTEAKDKVAAITALGFWGDDSAFPLLAGFLASAQDEALRSRAYDSAMRFVSEPSVTGDPARAQRLWTELAAQARTRADQDRLIRGLTNFEDDWAVKLVEGYKNSEDDKIADLAIRALDHMAERKRAKGGK